MVGLGQMAQESIELNGFGACVDMRVTSLQEHHTKDAARMSNKTARHKDAPRIDTTHAVGSTLDTELPSEKVHIMKLHTNGEEDAILRGARNFQEWVLSFSTRSLATSHDERWFFCRRSRRCRTHARWETRT
eukprot:GEMP01076012.1.p1 GENE.GEMP01076012.1~~GEMP01076012.1.p1  ORF type:complete len:132 (+),score=34.19 GEMP01076012.1:366-761(+)